MTGVQTCALPILMDTKMDLIHCEIQRDESDISVEEMEELLEKKVPTKLLKDDIKEATKQIVERTAQSVHGNKIDLTDADIERRQIELKKMKKLLKLKIPERKLRLKLNTLKIAKNKIDAPEQQISKLKKNIRDKAFYRPVPKQKSPTGVN